jgi:predicted N-acyltransferase
MDIRICHSLDQVPAHEWNRLVVDNNPFLRHEFLSALEQNDCVGAHFGWQPRHLLVYRDEQLVAAVPLYLKENSYGEFVFDFAWADAYQRNGLSYYPKLVSSIPYTPATGQRILEAPQCDETGLYRGITEKMVEMMASEGASSIHTLFLSEDEMERLQALGWSIRRGVQFHWHNRDYRDFDHFLQQLNNRRRKNIRRERNKVEQAGISLEVLHGNEVSPQQWDLFSRFYAKTFEERYSLPTLNAGFFRDVGRSLGQQVILVLAYHEGECVAGALMFRSDTTLYGRHWGCERDFDSLHFEACYYQGIEYCIRHGLERFEPGAQGEHKIWRGFMPVWTYSSHWIAHPGFRGAIDDFLQRENRALEEYKSTLEAGTPYKKAYSG